MVYPKPINKSPQVGVRFAPEDMERLREFARRHYAGNVSTMVKVAVFRMMDAEKQDRDGGEREERAA